MPKAIENALTAWRNLLGTENVIVEQPQLTAATVATFATNQRIVAILKPADRGLVQECLKIANQYKTPVYPISSGKNWGYGSAVPVESDCAILDLGKLNRIIDYDENLGHITLEPGVTQGQLFNFLKEKQGKFWMDATGSSESCSIIGNTVERGFGHGPYADHFAYVCGFEVVLPNGDCLRTGFKRFAGATTGPVFRWGVGPHIDGLFTHSNFGIVTQMTLWLMPAPEYFQAYYFSIEKDNDLEELIEALRPLRLKGTIKSAVHIGNAYRVLSSIQQYPWHEAGEVTPLPKEILDALAKKWDFGAWSGSGALYGTRQEVAEARRQIKQALRNKVKKLRFIDDRTLQFVERIQKPLKWITGLDVPAMLKIVRPVHDLMKGKPTDQFIASAYWRKKTPLPTDLNPDRDQCGLIWCSPLAPLAGRDARAMADIATDTLSTYGFEPGMTMTLLTERCLENVISITYDRSVAGEDERAMACYRTLSARLIQAGYYPYRLGIHAMNTMEEADKGYRKFHETLKSALDPDNILAPGRYQI